MDKEIWKDIEGYEGKYQVSNLGRVRSLIGNKKILSPAHIKGNYLLVNLRYSKGKLIHRLVAEAFVPNPKNKPEVNHIDGNKENNRAENLEWVTPKENTKHAHDIGLVCHPTGQEHPRSKFTNQQIKQIRNEHIANDKKYGARALAKKYGVASSTIDRIIKNQRYRNI